MSWQLKIMHVKRWPQLKAQNDRLKTPSLNHQLIVCDFKIQNVCVLVCMSNSIT